MIVVTVMLLVTSVMLVGCGNQVQPANIGGQGQNQVNPLPGDDADYLVGVWVSDTQTAFGPMHAETILNRDGSFSQTTNVYGLMTYDVGHYELRQAQGFIHFTIDDHEPKEYLGRRMTWPESWGYYYTILGPNQMKWEDRTINASWTVTR
jgi:hypothetical protein